MFSVGEGGRVRLKLDVQGQEIGGISDADRQDGVGGLENWRIFMDIICVLSLKGSPQMQFL